MPNKKTTSARGETIDFDMLMIKAQLESVRTSVDVNRRSDYIDSKMNNKKVSTSEKTELQSDSESINEDVIEEDIVEDVIDSTDEGADPLLPTTEELDMSVATADDIVDSEEE